ncbi:hypothetical protein AGOR_G00123810 [Albula goreensis]|uniref:Ig-like domain-containing protein n=1 Tax=Albula goreensis TaxID=1534307 RepID=A0A8T3DAZ1_9TELE|nr:hypothetical protein AGOR_G00123810 [Albula goreensis]
MSTRCWAPLVLIYMGWMMGRLDAADTIHLHQPPQTEAEMGHNVTVNCTFNYNGNTSDRMFGKFYVQNSHQKKEYPVDVMCQSAVSSDKPSACHLSHTIVNASPKDENVYLCEVKIPSSEGSIEVRGHGTNLSVYAEPSLTVIQPLSPLVSGSEATLECRVHGFYPQNPSVMWFHRGAPVPPSDITNHSTQNNDGTFTLHSRNKFSPTVEDHNTETVCQVSHPVWRYNKTASISLNVSYGPITVNVTSDTDAVTNGSVRVTNGSSLILRCVADGNPRPGTQWLGGSIKTAHHEETLHISAVKKEDGGVYLCVVKNEYGELNTSLTLLVTDRDSNDKVSNRGDKALYSLAVISIILADQGLQPQGQEPLHDDSGPTQDVTYAVPKSHKKKAKRQPAGQTGLEDPQLVYADILFPLAPQSVSAMDEVAMTIYSEVGKKKEHNANRRDQAAVLDSIYTLAELPS